MEERNYKLYVHISPSGKMYYGITCQKVEYRWHNGKGYKENKHFTNSINKYGWDNFEHKVLFDNLTKEEACLLEQCYIALYATTNSKYGYNNSLGGERTVWSEKSKKKLSESMKGKQHSNETKKKMSESHKGKQTGENNGMYGKHHTEEAKRKMSIQRTGENNPNYGKPMTQEQKRKISEARKGKHHSEETKRKLSESHKGKHLTEEHKKKISEAKKNMSEETKNKISESMEGKNNPNSKPIIMFTLEGEFIRRFDCRRDANDYLRKPRNNDNINKCARGINKTAYGYIWKYEEDYIKEQEQQAI